MKGFFFILCATGTLFSAPSLSLDGRDEMEAMDSVIKISEERLQKQKRLRLQMEEMGRIKALFTHHNVSKNEAIHLIRLAKQILLTIEDEHLQQLFNDDYLEELAFFTSIANKSSPVAPSE